ncbi:sugar O-acyltransferase (sialic acid O-acetyltransferase NeuD family) [Pedobacter sp. CG_S7]|uniref:acetyltransferase n=1 Tax=Pedobacter sp. CG_S7 TaxID=3143930 RepID=UPI003395A2F0
MHIIGASGHAKVIIEILKINSEVILGVWDDNQELKNFQGLEISGNIAAFKQQHVNSYIIAIGNNKIRKQIAEQLEPTLKVAVHPGSSISPSVILGKGTVIMPNATINVDCKIGNHVIINSNASVDHDCQIGDFVHISPQVALAGNVKVAEGTHIGVGACVIQGVNIGKWSTVGAGAVVIRDVPDYAVVVGNPASVIKYNSKIINNEK